jgi:GxxExxY protein
MRGELLEADRVYSIVASFYTVHNYFGFGLSETIYAGALYHELVDRGHQVGREVASRVLYKGRPVAMQRLDMVVDDRVIVEIKATELLSPSARPQLLTYLRATRFEVGVLLHFGPKPNFYRFIDSPKRPSRIITPAPSSS